VGCKPTLPRVVASGNRQRMVVLFDSSVQHCVPGSRKRPRSIAGRRAARIRGQLGAQIRDLRTDAGASLRALAEQAGVEFGYLAQVERGVREPSISALSAIAEALYVGLVTDTGRFQYSNTTPKALRLAAELVEAGADVHGIFRHVYETVQFAKLKLLARALDRAQLFEGGRLLVSHLLRSDFEEVGAEEPYSEGIIDYLRQAEGAELVALIREPPSDGGPKRRVSLRSSRDEVDVSALARRSGGGGHRQAAGFASEASVEEITEFIRRGFVEATDGADAADAAAGE